MANYMCQNVVFWASDVWGLFVRGGIFPGGAFFWGAFFPDTTNHNTIGQDILEISNHLHSYIHINFIIEQ